VAYLKIDYKELQKEKKAMSEKLTAVEWLYFTLWKETGFSLPSTILDQAKEMEKEQTIKAAARGFLAMPEKFNLNDAKEFGEQYYKNTYDTKREGN
jgi:hypothetical protein